MRENIANVEAELDQESAKETNAATLTPAK
jgi:hypothetical protein